MRGSVRAFIAILLITLLSGCASAPTAPRRFAWVTGVKPEKVAYYKQLHANPWPSVNRKLKECSIQNYSIHLKEIDGRLFLFDPEEGGQGNSSRVGEIARQFQKSFFSNL